MGLSVFDICNIGPQIELALKEGNIPYKYYSVDLYNKPAFFTQINPADKVCGYPWWRSVSNGTTDATKIGACGLLMEVPT